VDESTVNESTVNESTLDESTWRDADGVDVFFRRWPTGNPPKAAVVIVHGASEHSARYDRFAQALNTRGYSAFALDQRGHGRTAEHTGTGRMGPRGTDGMLDDIKDLLERARAEVNGAPVFLFGHSMGSLIVQAFVERRDTVLAGLVLSGSLGASEGAAEGAAALQGAVDAGMGDEALDILGANNAPFEPARTRYDWLSRDPGEVDKYVADPLCGDEHPLTYGFVLELTRALADVSEPAGVARITSDLPILLITGDRDPVSAAATRVRELETRLRAAGLTVEARYYADARHELLNDTNRDEVTADVVEWLDKNVGPGSA
jgi:alpha-beta hydrolase superfamily lysophospholipase